MNHSHLHVYSSDTNLSRSWKWYSHHKTDRRVTEEEEKEKKPIQLLTQIINENCLNLVKTMLINYNIFWKCLQEKTQNITCCFTKTQTSQLVPRSPKNHDTKARPSSECSTNWTQIIHTQVERGTPGREGKLNNSI